MKTIFLFAIVLSTSAFHSTASEAIQRAGTLSELQQVLGIFVTTTELKLDEPLYARFVLVKDEKGQTQETILADLDFPATYFNFLNVEDARRCTDPTLQAKDRIKRYIKLTTWIGKQRQHPQGRTFEITELDVGPQAAGTSNYMQPNQKVNVKEDIVVYDDSKVNTETPNIKASQKLVLRLFPQRPANGEQPGAAQPATQPADKGPAEVQPPTPTSEDAPR